MVRVNVPPSLEGFVSVVVVFPPPSAFFTEEVDERTVGAAVDFWLERDVTSPLSSVTSCVEEKPLPRDVMVTPPRFVR